MGLLPDGLTGLVVRWLWPFRVRAVESPRTGQPSSTCGSRTATTCRSSVARRRDPTARSGAATSTPFTPTTPTASSTSPLRGTARRLRARPRAETGRRVMGEFFVVRSVRRWCRSDVRRARGAGPPGDVGDRLPGGERGAARFWRRLGARGADRQQPRSSVGCRTSRTSRRTSGSRERARVTIELPAGVLAMRDRGGDWAAWVDRLPALARDLLAEWELTVDGELMHGYCSLVVPVLTADGERAVLKLTGRRRRARFEHLALQRWHGNGAVLLLRADPHRWALLLERLHPRDLTTIGDLEACEVVAGLYAADPRAGAAAAAHGHVVRRALDRRPRGPAARRAHPTRGSWSRGLAGPRPGGRPGGGRRDASTATSTTRTCWPPTASRGW